MCEKSSILVIFLILKILFLVVIPIVLFILYKRENKIFNKVAYGEIMLLVLLIILRILDNGCVSNSTINGIKNSFLGDSEEVIYENIDANDTSKIHIEANTNYRTYNNNQLYYFNQNSESIRDSYYECSGKKVYANTYASGITAFATAISTLYNTSVTPVELFNGYKESYDVCSEEINSNNLITFFTKRYDNLKINEINSSQLASAIKNGNIVVAEFSANENSKLTCDSGYIVIYNIGLDGKYIIADPALPSKDFVCPYSSKAYGNIIKSNNMNESWYLSELNNEVIHYYSLYVN